MNQQKPRKKVAILGASPISIMYGVLYSNRGFDVDIIEASGSLGGAWKVVKTKFTEFTEIGCHFWSKSSCTYNFLSSKLRLVKMEPQPFFVLKKKKYNYWFRFFYEAIDFKYHKTKSNAFISLLGSYKELLKESLKIFPYKYPQGGSKELLDFLSQLITKYNLNIYYNTNVREIEELNNTTACLSFENTNSKIYDEVVLGSNVNIQRYHTSDKILDFSKYKKIHHFKGYFIHIAQKSKTLSYVRFFQNEIFSRVSDITYNNLEGNLGQRLICVELTSDGNTKNIISIFNSLKEMKLIESDGLILDYEPFQYSINRMDYNKLMELRKLVGSNVQILHSFDLTYSLEKILKEIA